MKTKLLALILIFIIYLKGNMSLADDSTLISYINQNKQNPLDYLMSKLRDNDIVLLGEKHKQDHQIEMVRSIIKRLSKELPSTILALEIPTDEQNTINHFLETGTGLEKIKLPLHLSNPLYKDLIVTARKSGIRVLAIDMPPRLFKNAQMTRDEYMANTLITEIEMINKAHKILVLVGNLHTIKAHIELLTVGNTYKYLGLLLNRKKPTLKVFSIYQETNKFDSDINESFSKFKECIACKIGEPLSFYQGRSLSLLNSKPTKISHAFDGIIYHN
jgi:uncharacterized iron-regulated protein